MKQHQPSNRASQPLAAPMTSSQHVYEVRPRKDHRGVDLISDALPFGRQVCQFLQSKSQAMQSGHSLAVSNYLGGRELNINRSV